MKVTGIPLALRVSHCHCRPPDFVACAAKRFFQSWVLRDFFEPLPEAKHRNGKAALGRRSRGQKGRSIGRRRPGLGKAGYGVVRNQGTDKKLPATQLPGM